MDTWRIRSTADMSEPWMLSPAHAVYQSGPLTNGSADLDGVLMSDSEMNRAAVGMVEAAAALSSLAGQRPDGVGGAAKLSRRSRPCSCACGPPRKNP